MTIKRWLLQSATAINLQCAIFHPLLPIPKLADPSELNRSDFLVSVHGSQISGHLPTPSEYHLVRLFPCSDAPNRASFLRHLHASLRLRWFFPPAKQLRYRQKGSGTVAAEVMFQR